MDLDDSLLYDDAVHYYDMDEDEEEEEYSTTNKTLPSSESHVYDHKDSLYQILSLEEVVTLMNASIDEVKTVIDLRSSITRILLNHFSWDKQKLYERYFDGNKKVLFADAHIIEPNPSGAKSEAKYSTTDSSDNKRKKRLCLCVICFCDVSAEDMAAISCGHEFCIFCWQKYLTTKIMEEGACTEISCAESGCDIIVDDETISHMIKDERVRNKYNQLMTKSFVASNRFLRWCPAPDCLNAVKVNSMEFFPIECSCGHVFCFNCGEKWHEPARCVIMKSWTKRCSGESAEKIDCETANWILSYTKECPKCKASIEKNGGCNHMTCRKCRFEFCWMCLQDWAKHGYQQSCNRYEDDKEAEARDTARANLQRYIHYWSRFQNHQQSLKAEKKQSLEVSNKMEELQRYNMSWVEVQFLKSASDILCNCRQTLMYSYPFAFYLAKNNNSLIFEDNQQNLETSTEKLAQFIEKDIEEYTDIPSMKQSILDISKFCEARRKILVQHINEGYDSDFWEFNSLD